MTDDVVAELVTCCVTQIVEANPALDRWRTVMSEDVVTASTEWVLENFEDAARRYCQNAGTDPDEMIWNGENTGVYMTTARWKRIARQLYDLRLRICALRDFGWLE